jgi:hypothetical protein
MTGAVYEGFEDVPKSEATARFPRARNPRAEGQLQGSEIVDQRLEGRVIREAQARTSSHIYYSDTPGRSPNRERREGGYRGVRM